MKGTVRISRRRFACEHARKLACKYQQFSLFYFLILMLTNPID